MSEIMKQRRQISDLLSQALHDRERAELQVDEVAILLSWMSETTPVDTYPQRAAAVGATMSQIPVQEGFSQLLRDIFLLLSEEVESDDAVEMQMRLARMAHDALKITI